MMKGSCLMGLCLGLSTLMSRNALSQQPTPPKPAGPKTLVGLVTDTIGNPVDSVELLIGSVKRHAMTRADGTFRFDDLKPGPYQIVARRLGFIPTVQSVTVDDKGGVVSFSIIQGIRALPPVVTSAARGGLSGVIGDTSYNIVEGAQIAVIASDHRVLSDSMGRFFLDLKPGKYMVNVTRPGYRSRLVSVTIPNDSGRRMTVWLTPSNRGQNARDTFAYDALGLRARDSKPCLLDDLYSRGHQPTRHRGRLATREVGIELTVRSARRPMPGHHRRRSNDPPPLGDRRGRHRGDGDVCAAAERAARSRASNAIGRSRHRARTARRRRRRARECACSFG